MFTFLSYYSQHQAAVKGLSWCPWQPNVLASGGGTADRSIKLWNCNNGSLMKTIDTKSQVCLGLSIKYTGFEGEGVFQYNVPLIKYLMKID